MYQMNVRKILSIAVLALTPIVCFVFPFACGFLGLPQGLDLLVLPIMLFGPILATFVFARIRRTPLGVNAAVCAVLYTAIVAAFFAGAPGAAAWTIGFAYNVRLTKHPKEIQKWAMEALAKYEKGQLKTGSKAEDWAFGQTLAESEIPNDIRNLWPDKPSIGIVGITKDGWITNPAQTNADANVSSNASAGETHCLAFSWYLSGMLVGSPDFKTTWNPWYIREIIPGVYAYCGMK